MGNVRPKPSEVAKTKSKNNIWFEKLNGEDQAWMNVLVQEIATVQDPAYHSIALSVIEIIKPNAHENTIVKYLKRKVILCLEKNQAK